MVLKRALCAGLIADGDMHLKNMALLKISEPGDKTFRSARMAPLYDAVTTRVFPRLEKDRLALRLNGKDDKLARADFRPFAATVGLQAAVAKLIVPDHITFADVEHRGCTIIEVGRERVRMSGHH